MIDVQTTVRVNHFKIELAERTIVRACATARDANV